MLETKTRGFIFIRREKSMSGKRIENGVCVAGAREHVAPWPAVVCPNAIEVSGLQRLLWC